MKKTVYVMDIFRHYIELLMDDGYVTKSEQFIYNNIQIRFDFKESLRKLS